MSITTTRSAFWPRVSRRNIEKLVSTADRGASRAPPWTDPFYAGRPVSPPHPVRDERIGSFVGRICEFSPVDLLVVRAHH